MPQTEYRQLLKRYAHYAPRYDRRFARYSAATLQQALLAIPPDTNAHCLLDVACGTGLFAEMLRRHRPELEITGVDVSPDMLEKARQRIPPVPGNRIRWIQGFAENLPLGSDQFDVVTCTNAFHLVQDSAAALAEFKRVLKPGGTLVLVDWCRDFPIMKIRNALLKVADRQRRNIRTLDQMVSELRDAGFAVTQAERFPAGLWGLFCIVAKSPSRAPVPAERPTIAGQPMAANWP